MGLKEQPVTSAAAKMSDEMSLSVLYIQRLKGIITKAHLLRSHKR